MVTRPLALRVDMWGWPSARSIALFLAPPLSSACSPSSDPIHDAFTNTRTPSRRLHMAQSSAQRIGGSSLALGGDEHTISHHESYTRER